MEIYSDTTIGFLNDNQLISTMLYNNFRRMNFSCIGDVIEFASVYGDEGFIKSHRFGRKALYELHLFFFKYNINITLSQIPQSLLSIFIDLSNEFYEKYIKEDTVFNRVYKNNSIFLDFILNFDETSIADYYVKQNFNIIDIIDLLQNSINILKDFYSNRKNNDVIFFILWKKIENMIDLHEKEMKIFAIFAKIELLKRSNIDIEFLLKSKLEEILSHCHVRSRNLYQLNNKTYTDALISHLRKTKINSYNPNSSSYKEINSISEQFYFYVENILAKCDNEIKIEIIDRKYPFLNVEGLRFLDDYINKNNKLPMFFLLVNYLRSSNKREIVIFKQYVGLYTEKRSRAEIAQDLGCSQERVRQLLNKTPKLIKEIDLFKFENWSEYSFGDKPFLPSYDPLIKECLQKEHLESLDVEIFLDLLNLIYEFRLLTIGSTSYFISIDLYNSFDFISAFSNIRHIISQNVAEEIKIPLKFFVESDWICGDNIDVYKYIVYDIIKLYIEEELHFDIRDEFVVIPSKNVSVENELYVIIKGNNSPMHLDDIFNVFKQKNPDSKYTESGHIRYHLLKSERIVSIGNTSTYSLKEWNDLFFTGTITDLMYKIIEEKDCPINISDLYNKIKSHFPTTTQKSILSLAGRDQFVKFENGFIGLKSKEYSAEYIPIASRLPFSVRLNDFIDFLKKHHHLPMNSGVDFESALYRWYNNVRAHRLDLTTEEIHAFNSVLDEYKDYLVTSVEYTFFRKCEDFRIYIEDNMEFPTYKKEPCLYSWFLKYKDKYLEFNDRRKYYFEDLLNLLKLYGFEC